MGKENPQKTDHLKIIGKGEKIYETQYEKQYEKQYEETDRIEVGGKIIETKGQSDVDKMSPSQLLAKAKELGVKDQLPVTPSGAVSKSAANIEEIKKIIKAAMPQPVAKPVTDTQAIIKEIQQEKEAKTAEETLETDEEAVPAPWTGVKKIIAGGQIKADQFGLEVGEELGIETGGTAPPGWMTSEGSQKEKLEGFGLVEGEADPKIYPKRTEKNVVDSDGTVLFGDETSKGSALTKRMAEKHGKAFIANPTSDELSAWLSDNNIETLNIAGNRTLSEGVKGMKDVLRKALGKPSDVASEIAEVTPVSESIVKKILGLNDSLEKIVRNFATKKSSNKGDFQRAELNGSTFNPSFFHLA